ncbi:hypothetical protein N7523_005782 [Penicillium sp. IBT 18751x]|nr:hypothetical protein N7523_005627 [Penicillium sp. IBT 18751x]KAJ6118031.1 hypothetical protein N7523_005782 [Penicillium sp. IBT 18751x]
MTTNIRSHRLARYLGAVLHGKQEVQDLSSFKRLLEAFLEQKDPCVTVERLIASPNALGALRIGLSSSRFLNHPGVKLLGNGLFLKQLLLVILEPRTLWNSFVEAFCTQKLDDEATQARCWLTVELLSLPTSSAVDIRADAQTILNTGSLSSSPLAGLRNQAHKIKHLLDMKSSATTLSVSSITAGGRHDNKFPDFRLIAILPTADEFGCTEKPFYRDVHEIARLSGSQRAAGHVENQFRLLREDMLSGLRDDFQVAKGTKLGRRPAFRICGLSLARVCCSSSDQKYLRPCTVGVTAVSGLDKLKNLPKEKRKAFLKTTPQFVKHRAFGCLIHNAEIVAFATIERDIDVLMSDHPIVMLRIVGEEALKKSLLSLKLYNDVDFLVVDTPTFAYEPILKCLQERSDFLSRKSWTGKSFIGALLSKVLHEHTQDKILVMCHTNHALDQFLEDMLDIGIDPSAIVRLGSKSTLKTMPLSLKEQSTEFKKPQSTWDLINTLKGEGSEQGDNLETSFKKYQQLAVDAASIIDYLEFEEPEYFKALTVFEDENGMILAVKRGKAAKKGYLYDRWAEGKGLKRFADLIPDHCDSLWALEQHVRNEKVKSWKRALLNEQAASLAVEMTLLDNCQEKLSALLAGRTRKVLKEKRIIGCTTTAAAMYPGDLRHASPGIVLLEETGEILESHVLTAISPETKHLILIGDHLQLRPKINSYDLSAEKGDSYDLNQHRMCPEISSLVRRLTYPELEDDEKTKSGPEPRGLRDRQGYGTDKLVVLTPYLGQLSLLKETLSKQNDPVLNDLDSYDLVRAGLLSQAGANHSKRQLKLSTIDNYQGEESEIVIASLTRSNKTGDIGFMAAPERLNVLLSPARNVLILVGNSETFVSSRKGQKVWKPLIDQLKTNGHLYNGLPVRCENHPEKNAIIRIPEDFDRETPDGGCSAPCGVKLNCGLHECQSKCHQLLDHSEMTCTRIVKWKCPRGHSSSLPCAQVKGSCRFCIQEDLLKERKRERDLKLETERQRRQAAYAQQLAEAQDEASHLRRLRHDEQIT